MEEPGMCPPSRGITVAHDREVTLSNHLIFEQWVACQNEIVSLCFEATQLRCLPDIEMTDKT